MLTSESLEAAGLHQGAIALVRRAGRGDPVSFEALPGGANNRVYRVRLASGQFCLLKRYFRDSADRRDRLGAEFAFLSFAWSHGVRAVPEPLGSDPEGGLGLYAFVEGRKAEPGELDRATVLQAAELVTELGSHRDSEAARLLPAASEACFTMSEHLDCITGRVERLSAIGSETDSERAAMALVKDDLRPAWAVALGDATRMMEQSGIPSDSEISPKERCLSPSDFGFHNALITQTGKVIFLDFEYAGWDDAAKLVCDFLCQPGVPIPSDLGPAFKEAVATALDAPSSLLARVDILMPLYRLKWICILLNEFLPTGKRRREFARLDDLERLRWDQLSKARRALSEWR